MSRVIEVSHLRKVYGRTTALHDLSLTVEKGTVFGLIGPNGAGKTTTLRTLLDIIRPTAGNVRVLGTSPREGGAALRRRIGYVPGELRLEGRMTGRQMLDFYARVSGPVAGKTIDVLAERLGADLSRHVRTLSKGNKQKLGLIQAFMHTPELLILDEPTSGLDPLVQREFLALVHEARNSGQTVLLSSHVLSEIQQAADSVAVLADGRIVAEGDVASLRLGSVRRVRATLQIPGAAEGASGVVATTRRAFAHLPGADTWNVQEIDGGVSLAGTIEGAIDPFVKALTAFDVRDLTVEEPDLEESVLRMYGAEPSAHSPSSRRHTRRHHTPEEGA